MRRKVWSDNDLHHALGGGSVSRIEFGAEGGEDSWPRGVPPLRSMVAKGARTALSGVPT